MIEEIAIKINIKSPITIKNLTNSINKNIKVTSTITDNIIKIQLFLYVL